MLPPATPAAASERSASLVHAPGTTRGTALAVWPSAVYVQVGDAVLPVVTSGALRLPTAVVVPEPVGWGVRQGEEVFVGGGDVRFPGLRVQAVRTWRPLRVEPARAVVAAGAALAALVADHPWRGAAEDVVGRLQRGEPVEPAVAGLVGAGPGLTPSGDDLLCGVLLALRLRGDESAREALWAAVRPRLGATTSLSGSLLTEAAEGYAVPALVRLAGAVAARDGEGALELAAQVAAIGHTSGTDLLAGFVTAVQEHVGAQGGSRSSAATAALEGAHS